RHQLPSGKERIELAKIKLAARLKVLLEEGDLEQYENMFATFKQEGLTLHQLAASLLKMHFAPMLQQSQSKSSSHSSGREERSGRGKRDSGGSKGKRGKHSGESDMIRLFLSVGKKDKVSKGDIVGAVSGLSNMSSSNIGVIDIYDKFSFIEVNGEFLNDVLSNVNGNKIKGRKVNVEIAKD
ncbi:MAG TPA: DbpA RNA binding domain-containing protein, partial [Bacteroidia bacterium]|nr:DbpA RNA binding domain-containing protein [Bacteroidia bacterium]